MQLIYRDIATVENHNIKLTLPDYIDAQQVEVIIIPIKKEKESKDFDAYFGVSNIGTEQIDKHLQKSRDGWNRTILD